MMIKWWGLFEEQLMMITTLKPDACHNLFWNFIIENYIISRWAQPFQSCDFKTTGVLVNSPL